MRKGSRLLMAPLLITIAVAVFPVGDVHPSPLESCGYHDLYIQMEQVPDTWGSWTYNNNHMWYYNQCMDIYRSRTNDGSWGRNGENEFGGFPTDADLYYTWGFLWGDGLAMTCFSWDCVCCEILESDLVFNPAYRWTADKPTAEANPDSYLYYNSVLLHEMGHTWGEQTRYEDYSYAMPTVMHAYNPYSVQDNMAIHAPDAYLLRRTYLNQTQVQQQTNIGIHSKFANATYLEWTNSTTDKTAYQIGDRISVNNLTVENTGIFTLRNVHVRFYLSPDRTITTSDIPLGSGDWYWKSYPAEAWGIYNFLNMTIPKGVPNGSYYVGAILTYSGYASDVFGEDNSTHIWSKITVGSPDLVITSLTATPSTPQAGENVTVSAVVSNQGAGPAGRFYLDIYKGQSSAPAALKPGDAWCSFASLAAGESTTCTATVSYPAAGTFSMWAQADTDLQVAESNENNNIYGPLAITVGASRGGVGSNGAR